MQKVEIEFSIMIILTIAIPFYNSDKFLARAIESVLWQTYSDWELLLVDDGSTDMSLEIAKRYEVMDSRIKVISDGDNRNLGFRLNQIAKLSESKYLARMDADDIMHPRRIERQIDILERNPEIDILGTNVYSIDENENIIGLRYKKQSIGEIQDVKIFVHPTIMGKTEWFKVNPYDVKAERIEDTELWLRTKYSSNFKNFSEPLLFYREIGNNYWKKYFKGNKAVFYVLVKHRFKKDFFKFALRYYVAGVTYFIFNLFGMENILIKNRNKIHLKALTVKNILNEK